MKAISLLQPWASLCVHTDENGKALKQIETRSWNTKHRGDLLIHASMGKKHLKDSVSNMYEFMNNSVYGEFMSGTLPFGAIIGKVNLVDTFPTNDQFLMDSDGIFMTDKNGTATNNWSFTEQELAFGDYSPNRFGWLLSYPILFKEPIPCKGQLSIWNVPNELLEAVNHQIQIATS